MAKLSEYIELTYDSIERDKKRDALFKQIDDIWNLKWPEQAELMSQLPWAQAIVSTDGHDALRAVQRVLSRREPQVTVWPMAADPLEIARADRVERGLKWYMNLALGRGRGSSLSKVVMSSAKYDEITGQVVHLPYQIKLFGKPKTRGKDKEIAAGMERRIEAMERGGEFSYIIRNPRHVHAMYTDYGVESVVYGAIWKPEDIVNFYLGASNQLALAIIKEEAAEEYAVFDVVDYSNRVAFCIPVEGGVFPMDTLEMGKLPDGGFELLNVKNEFDFLPWICRMGGDDLNEDEGEKRIPMLYSLARSGQYHVKNIIDTIVVSEAIAHAAAPRGKKSGPGSRNIRADFGSPELDVELETGQDYERLAPPELDQSLFQLSNWITGKTEKSTVPRILQGGDVPTNTFATLNLAVSSGMTTIDPYKKLAEDWLADSGHQILAWVDWNGKPMKVVDGKRGLGGEKIMDVYELHPSDFKPQGMRISVELIADAPVNKTEKITGARMLREMGMPTRALYEELGEADARGLIEESQFERLENFFFDRFMTKITQRDELEMNMAMQESQMALQMQAQEQQAALQQEAQGQMQAQQMQMQQQAMVQEAAMRQAEQAAVQGSGATQGIEGVEGMGMNPNEGGPPAALANPAATREGQTGVTASGEDLEDLA